MYLLTSYILCSILFEAESVPWYPYHPSIILSEQDSNLITSARVYRDKINILTSPNYPNKYYANQSLMWTAEADDGFNVVFNCTFSIPCGDSLLMYNAPSKASEQCSFNQSQSISDGNFMTLVLKAKPNSKGGKFQCYVRPRASPKACKHCGCNDNRGIIDTDNMGDYYTMVAGIYDKGTDIMMCAGAIIKENIIATAAECLIAKTVNTMGVVVSPYDVKKQKLPGKTRLDIVSVWTPVNDGRISLELVIGYVKTRNMRMSQNVVPACISADYTPEKLLGKRIYMLGWHYLNNYHKLLRAEIEHLIIGFEACADLQLNVHKNDSLCTVTEVATHMNVRGSPLFYGDKKSGLIYFVGVAAASFYENNQPEFHATTAAHMDWLKKL